MNGGLKMKKAIAMLLTIALCLCSFAGCGKTENTQTAPAPTAAAATAAAGVVPAGDMTLNMLSHTYAALTYFADQMVANAPDGVTVVPEMTDYTSWQEKMRLNLSSKSNAYDITYITPSDLGEFASNGWLVPLDDYIQKYWDEYNFGDIPQYLWDAYTYDGHIYGIPSHQWAMDLFYRADLLDEAGIAVPENLDQLVEAAKALNKDGRSGICLTLQATDMLMVTYQSFLTACGGWFWDDNYEPQFSSEASLRAIDYMLQLYQYTPDDCSSYGNNEATVAMCQDLCAMTMMQTTRSAAMNDPAQSQVSGKISFAAAPMDTKGGKSAAIWNTAGYSICASSTNDPETCFVTIANALTEEAEAGCVSITMPIRESALTDELFAQYPDYAAAWKAIQNGATIRPAIPEFAEIMDVSMTALSTVITGQADLESTMQAVDADVRDILDEAGYYG